jgi:hypothetical protein
VVIKDPTKFAGASLIRLLSTRAFETSSKHTHSLALARMRCKDNALQPTS